MFLFYYLPFLHVCNRHENVLFFTLILGSVFSDFVAFYVDTYPDLRTTRAGRKICLSGKSPSWARRLQRPATCAPYFNSCVRVSHLRQLHATTQ